MRAVPEGHGVGVGCAGDDSGVVAERAIAPPITGQKDRQCRCSKTGGEVHRAGVATDNQGRAAEQRRELSKVGWRCHEDTVAGRLDHRSGARFFAGTPRHYDLEPVSSETANNFGESTFGEDLVCTAGPGNTTA